MTTEQLKDIPEFIRVFQALQWVLNHEPGIRNVGTLYQRVSNLPMIGEPVDSTIVMRALHMLKGTAAEEKRQERSDQAKRINRIGDAMRTLEAQVDDLLKDVLQEYIGLTDLKHNKDDITLDSVLFDMKEKQLFYSDRLRTIRAQLAVYTPPSEFDELEGEDDRGA